MAHLLVLSDVNWSLKLCCLHSFEECVCFKLRSNWHVILCFRCVTHNDLYLYILWNIHHNKSSSHLLQHIGTNFFLMMIIFKIFFSNFEIYNAVLLTIVTTPYITSPGLLTITGSFVSFNYLYPFHPLPTFTSFLWAIYIYFTFFCI